MITSTCNTTKNTKTPRCRPWRRLGLLSTIALSLGFAVSTSAQAPAETGAPDQETPALPPASLSDESFDIPRPRRLIPEGTFVVSRDARLIPVNRQSMVWIVEFENEPGLPLLPAMYLMPSRRLQRLETSMFGDGREPAPEELQVVISGQVFAFDRYNFLMLTAMPRSIVQRDAQQSETQATSQADSADLSTQNQPQTDDADQEQAQDDRENLSADVEAMIEEIESEGPVAPLLQRPAAGTRQSTSTGATPTAPRRADEEDRLLTEGTFILNRAVRLVRSPINGAWTVVFEADSDGLEDPPLIVLPCRLLEQMASRAQQFGDAFILKVSGQVYTSGDWNYLLPTMMEIPYERDNLSP